MEAAIEKYLALKLGVPSVKVSHLLRIPGGASRETWMFKAVWNDEEERHAEEFVLRLDPPASLVESEREHEYAFYRAFEGHPEIPVPRMRWLETGPEHMGAPFFIMDRIPNCESSPRTILEPFWAEARPMLARRKYEILGRIARFDWRGSTIESVIAPPALDACWKRELDYWEDMIDRHEISPQPISRAAIRWLRANPPPPAERISVVHGDYRTGNFLYRTDGIHGIVDWEMAHLGDPLEDLAWSFMEAWEWARDGKKGGIIDVEDAIAAWEHTSGMTVDRDALRWWDVLMGVKGQALWLTGAHSFADGRSSELILAMTAYWLNNFQDEILLRSMGRSA
ncbi:MAG: phosphotransferase family protein [Dehalococcoidia bacterium]|nr:phosphotransferase family protein [Dehalococcoidia bacterium]